MKENNKTPFLFQKVPFYNRVPHSRVNVVPVQTWLIKKTDAIVVYILLNGKRSESNIINSRRSTGVNNQTINDESPFKSYLW